MELQPQEAPPPEMPENCQDFVEQLEAEAFFEDDLEDLPEEEAEEEAKDAPPE